MFINRELHDDDHQKWIIPRRGVTLTPTAVGDSANFPIPKRELSEMSHSTRLAVVLTIAAILALSLILFFLLWNRRKSAKTETKPKPEVGTRTRLTERLTKKGKTLSAIVSIDVGKGMDRGKGKETELAYVTASSAPNSHAPNSINDAHYNSLPSLPPSPLPSLPPTPPPKAFVLDATTARSYGLEGYQFQKA